MTPRHWLIRTNKTNIFGQLPDIVPLGGHWPFLTSRHLQRTDTSAPINTFGGKVQSIACPKDYSSLPAPFWVPSSRKMASRPVPLRRALAQLSMRNTRIVGRNAPKQFRGYSTGGEPPRKPQFTVWRPYLRLAIGVPFIGALIYSMVKSDHPNF